MLVQSFFSLSAVDDERFEVYGQAGKLLVDRCYALDIDTRAATREHFRLKRMWRGVRTLRHAPFLVTKTRAPAHEPSYPLALARFVAAVRSNRSLHPDLWDGYRCLAVIDAAQISAASGMPVSLPERLDLAGDNSSSQAAGPA